MWGKNRENEFFQVYEDLADPVFRHCYFRLSDREKAKDLVQETFKRLWERMSMGDHIESYRAFVFRIANNLIIDSYRKKKEDSLDALQEEGFDIGNEDHDEILKAVMARELMTMLDRLNASYRDVIVMRYIDDMPVYEIAAILKVTENVVSVRIYRALEKLRKLSEEQRP